MSDALGSAVRAALMPLRDAERAEQQQAYMKSSMPYIGIPMGQLRQTVNAVVRDNPPGSAAAWQASIRDLWRNASFREERHAAIELLNLKRLQKHWLDPDMLPMIGDLIVEGAWWDYVDAIATNTVHTLLHRFRAEVTPTLEEWSRDANLWLRRTAIICQLKSKSDTDLQLLSDAITRSLDDDDFFARKAIGWALRQHARTDPQWVLQFVSDNDDALSALSKREALKHLR